MNTNGRTITYNGITKTIYQWARVLDVSDVTLRRHLAKNTNESEVLQSLYKGRGKGMAVFCGECHSIVIKGNCTNKRCTFHTKSSTHISFDQLVYIMDMSKKLNEECDITKLRGLLKKDASDIIKGLQERLDLGDIK